MIILQQILLFTNGTKMFLSKQGQIFLTDLTIRSNLPGNDSAITISGKSNLSYSATNITNLVYINDSLVSVNSTNLIYKTILQTKAGINTTGVALLGNIYSNTTGVNISGNIIWSNLLWNLQWYTIYSGGQNYIVGDLSYGIYVAGEIHTNKTGIYVEAFIYSNNTGIQTNTMNIVNTTNGATVYGVQLSTIHVDNPKCSSCIGIQINGPIHAGNNSSIGYSIGIVIAQPIYANTTGMSNTYIVAGGRGVWFQKINSVSDSIYANGGNIAGNPGCTIP